MRSQLGLVHSTSELHRCVHARPKEPSRRRNGPSLQNNVSNPSRCESGSSVSLRPLSALLGSALVSSGVQPLLFLLLLLPILLSCLLCSPQPPLLCVLETFCTDKSPTNTACFGSPELTGNVTHILLFTCHFHGEILWFRRGNI